jgi:hypothetical protein
MHSVQARGSRTLHGKKAISTDRGQAWKILVYPSKFHMSKGIQDPDGIEKTFI